MTACCPYCFPMKLRLVSLWQAASSNSLHRASILNVCINRRLLLSCKKRISLACLPAALPCHTWHYYLPRWNNSRRCIQSFLQATIQHLPYQVSLSGSTPAALHCSSCAKPGLFLLSTCGKLGRLLLCCTCCYLFLYRLPHALPHLQVS